MTKTTALLLLGAIMVIVASLVGKDGTVAHVASMDQDRLAAAINDQSKPSSGGQPVPTFHSGTAGLPEIVNPTIVDETDLELEDDMAAELPVEDFSNHTAESDGGDSGAFDPRIG